MNRLTISQRVAKEAGISGTGMSTTVNQSGDYGRIVNWVDDSWLELQGMFYNWRFLWAQTTFNTTDDGATDYTPASTINRHDLHSFTIYEAAEGVSDETTLKYVPYHLWRAAYGVGSLTSGRPAVFTILPNDDVRIGPNASDKVYTVSFDYWKKPTAFSGDSSEPSMNTHHHMILVYMALIRYAEYESANEVLITAEREYIRMLAALKKQELPEHTLRLTPLA